MQFVCLLQKCSSVVAASPETYSLQHQSFNESDSLFAELVCTLDGVHTPQTSPSTTEHMSPCSAIARLTAHKHEAIQEKPQGGVGLHRSEASINLDSSMFSQNAERSKVGVTLGRSKFYQNTERSKVNQDANECDNDDNLIAALDVAELDEQVERDDNCDQGKHEGGTTSSHFTKLQSECQELPKCCDSRKQRSDTANTHCSPECKPPAVWISSVKGNRSVEDQQHSAYSTPQKRPGCPSFRDRMKHTLQRNASVVTPLASRLERRRGSTLQGALREAAEIQQGGWQFDIGPFFGLPSTVQHLLESHRGIKHLYGLYWLTEKIHYS